MWTNQARWSDGLPDANKRVEIRGNSSVTIEAETYLAADLEIGLNAGDHSRVQVQSGQLILLQDSLRIGEYTGSEGEFDLEDGAMHGVMDVFVGAASSVPGRATKATLRIQGGSFLGRTLTVGAGLGAESLLSVEGSRPSAVHALDYVYIEAQSDAAKAGNAMLSFTLDEHGVTPITIQSRADGLRIIHDAQSQCHLQIQLSAIPPREDITLVAAHVPTRGEFDGLPEGSEITAEYQGHLYRWKLTYHGGSSGNDLVLINRSQYASDAPITHVRPLPEIPKPLWLEHPLDLSPAKMTGETAFPGAEGFGAFTRGGRGGKNVVVTSLNDSGPGSLRAAIEIPGSRKITFRVGGVIALQLPITIVEPFVTIDGRNAPGDGIMLRNHGIYVSTHDVVLRYLRIRVGDDDVRTAAKPLSYYEGGEGDYALYFIEGSKNCIADHLSLSWSTSKMLSTTKGSDLITIQWSILSESLNFAEHGYASIAGGNRVTWHHNLFAHNQSRNVRFQGMVEADFRNNVIYDWGEKAAYGEFNWLNYVGNYLKAGPSTTQKPQLFHDGKAVLAPKSMFVAGNILEGYEKVTQNNWRGMGYYYFDRANLSAARLFPTPPVTTEPAQMAYEHVLQEAGATLPRRDAVDQRIVREVRDGTGHIINWVKDAGGWPEFLSTASNNSGGK